MGKGDTSVWYTDWSGCGRLCDAVPFVHISDTLLTLKDLVSNMGWCLDGVRTWISPEVYLLFQSVSPHLNPVMADHWVWQSTGNDAKKWSIQSVLRNIDLAHDDFLRYLGPQGCTSLDDFRRPLWVPPPAGCFKINVDGSFYPNSLHMGFGGVIRDSDCKWVLGFNGFAGLGDILSAELFAILHGLTIAWDKGLFKVILESDSLEAIEILQLGLLDSSSPHLGVVFRIKEVLSRQWNVKLLHISREINKPADALAKAGAFCADPLVLLSEPPPEVDSLILLDDPG
ncbi:Ribonuclease H domain [Sesbania bispinosa]|nr:Ribonuclease H domain [Sesbania bispinosa]